MFHEALAKIHAAGVNPERVAVPFDAFRDWCRAEGLPLDSAARASYVSELLRLRHREARGRDV